MLKIVFGDIDKNSGYDFFNEICKKDDIACVW